VILPEVTSLRRAATYAMSKAHWNRNNAGTANMTITDVRAR